MRCDTQVHYDNGSYIIRQFARGDLFYIITKGKVRELFEQLLYKCMFRLISARLQHKESLRRNVDVSAINKLNKRAL